LFVKGRNWIPAAGSAALLLLIACGGGGGGGGSAGGPTTGASASAGSTGTTAGSNAAAIQALEFKYIALTPRSVPANRAAYVASALKIPGVKEAGWSPQGDNFYAIFTDGTPYAMLDNLKPLPTPIASGTPLVETSATAIPSQKKAVVIFSLGDAFGDPTIKLEQMLKDAKYSVTPSIGTLSFLMSDVTGVGYFYWHTHSGFAHPEAAEPFALVSTGSDVTPESEASALIKQLKADKMIATTSVIQDRIKNPIDENKNGKIDEEEQFVHKGMYAITPKFVRTYFKFGPSSSVMQDSCTSADVLMQSAYQDAGAKIFFGWDKVTQDNNRMVVLTDRLLGANVMEPKETPPQRPFEWTPVLDWMHSKNLDSDGGASHITVTQSGDGGLLAPSISSLIISEALYANSPSKINIFGMFGPRNDGLYKREVFVNGQSLNITGGTDTMIEADMPNTGPGVAGDCQVKVAERVSNIVPITLWEIKFKFNFDGPASARYDVDLTYKLRLDIHRPRELPGGELKGDVRHFLCMNQGTATFTSSGTYSDGCTHNWSGSGSTGPPPGPGTPYYMALFGEVDVKNRKFVTFIPIATFSTPVTDNFVCPKGNGKSVLPPSVATSAPIVPTIAEGTYAIVAGQGTLTTALGVGTLKWETTMPQFPPTDKTKS
jgi:hypothetical protein